jgi:hypothetical protein
MVIVRSSANLRGHAKKSRAKFSPLHKEGELSPDVQAIVAVWFLP